MCKSFAKTEAKGSKKDDGAVPQKPDLSSWIIKNI